MRGACRAQAGELAGLVGFVQWSTLASQEGLCQHAHLQSLNRKPARRHLQLPSKPEYSPGPPTVPHTEITRRGEFIYNAA